MIDHQSVERIFDGSAAAINSGRRRIHLLFQSDGGEFGPGLSLYNFFRNIPAELIIYNAGSVQSMAVIAYLGAHKRLTNAHAFFMIHKMRSGEMHAPASFLHLQAERMRLCDAACTAIIQERCRIPDDGWTRINNDHELNLSAEEAKSFGVANEIGEFSPPIGSEIFSW